MSEADTKDEAKAIEQTATEKADDQAEQQASEKKVSLVWLSWLYVGCTARSLPHVPILSTGC